MCACADTDLDRSRRPIHAFSGALRPVGKVGKECVITSRGPSFSVMAKRFGRAFALIWRPPPSYALHIATAPRLQQD